MSMRLAVLALISVIAIGCGATPTEKPDSTQGESKSVVESPKTPTQPTAAPARTRDPTAVPTPALIVLTGTGDYLSDPFELQQGLMFMYALHKGSSYFNVTVLAEEGDDFTISVGTYGVYDGWGVHSVNLGAYTGLEPGLHRLEIETEGAWSVDIRNTMWTEILGLPQSKSGSGDSFIGPVMFNAGTIPLKATHAGSSFFGVQVFSTDGKEDELIVFSPGEYQGSKAIRVQKNDTVALSPGLYVVGVRADGDWTIEIGD